MAKYSKEKAKEIADLVASGDYRIVDLCKKAGIHHETYYEWQRSKPEFSELIKKAEAERIESFKNMARSGLAKMLDVFEYEEEHIEYVDDPLNPGHPKIKSKKILKKIMMPNPTAVIFALCNRDPENFKNIQHINHSGTIKQSRTRTIDNYTALKVAK